MRETDISQYIEKNEPSNPNIPPKKGPVKTFFKGVWKILLTVMLVFVTAFLIVGVSLSVYIIGISSEPTGINLTAKALNQTSFIYVKDDKTGEFEEYQSLYDTENRIWVNFEDIPQAMKNAMVAIEDKRFYEHSGVDWTRTLGAVLSLATGTDSYGGSTLTQQLIKNVTDDNDVSLTRKLREIIKALKLEQEYTKDQILEAYLNVVNFGNNCQGCESASELYFNKSISECSIAECAAIAGITQNPSKWNPLVYPDNNKIRRETVLKEMFDQGMISEEEYNKAMEESANMKFVGYTDDNNDDDDDTQFVQNWYIDELVNDLQHDLAKYYNISTDAAANMLYTEGLKIYCAMDVKAQETLENAALNIDKSSDPNLQTAMSMLGLDGRVIATVGSSNKKTGNMLFNRATDSVLQPGSSIKPVVVYSYAIEHKQLYFSSFVNDAPLEKYKVVDGQYVSGPNNWYSGYRGQMLLPDAIEISSNGTAVQVMDMIGTTNAYDQVVTFQGFTHLDENDRTNTGGLSIGGLTGGVTVREMAAAYNYMGNGGLYYEPYTYYYVTDAEDNIILSPQDNVPKQAYSPETAYIMNRLLHYNITHSTNTNAGLARVSGWDIIGKTGTTDEDKDSWFCGMSPYATLAIWTGFDTPQTISVNGQRVATTTFAKVMSEYLKDKEQKEFDKPGGIVEAYYSPSSGQILSSGSSSYVGYYTEDNMPGYGSYVEDDDDKDTENNNEENGSEHSGSSSGENNAGGENNHSSGSESSSNSSGSSQGEHSGESSSGGEDKPDGGNEGDNNQSGNSQAGGGEHSGGSSSE